MRPADLVPTMSAGRSPLWSVVLQSIGLVSDNLAQMRETPSGRREHGVAAGRDGGRNFLLHDIPMLDDSAALNSEDVDRNRWFWSPAGIRRMNHYEVTVCDVHFTLYSKVGKGG